MMMKLSLITLCHCPVPEIIDPVFAKTNPKRSFCMTENERFGLVFAKTGSINSGTALCVSEAKEKVKVAQKIEPKNYGQGWT
jgi:hypothetical protein